MGCYCCCYNAVHSDSWIRMQLFLDYWACRHCCINPLLHKGNWQEGSEQDNEINLERLIVQQKGFPIALAIVIHIAERLLFSRCVDWNFYPNWAQSLFDSNNSVWWFLCLFHPALLFLRASRRFSLLIVHSPSFVAQFIFALFLRFRCIHDTKILLCVVAYSLISYDPLTLKKMSAILRVALLCEGETIATVIGVRSAMTDTFTFCHTSEFY